MVCAIVLAAGRSQRMGTQKLLLPFAGSTVVARVVDAFLDAPVDEVAVVVRADDTRIRTSLASRRLIFVENPDQAGDMLSSVRCALRALPAATDLIAVAPGDQPSLDSELIRRMLSAFRACPGGILVPVCQGRRGHPLMFAGRFRNEVLTSHDGTGLRGLLHSHPAEVVEWSSPDAAVLQDLDTPEDYQRTVRHS
jgi:molybdenum cofactor cytidylyltransferase